MVPCPTRGVTGVLISQKLAVEPAGGQTTASLTHGQCDARPTVTFPAAEHHHPLTGTKIYCLINRCTHVCEVVNNLPRVVTWQCTDWESNQRLSVRPVQSDMLHYQVSEVIKDGSKNLKANADVDTATEARAH